MKYRIMVVEDDEPILDLMDMLLRKLGYEPVLIANGLLALEMIRKDPPGLILLDIMMTPIDGWEFLEKLRGEYGIQDVPVIIFSASPSVEERMEQIKDPRLGVLHKPVSFSELRAGIGQFLPAP
jgi:DNA-binding response OmpR family regulator